MNDIKSMQLYTHVERIDNELAELGNRPGDPLSVDELSAFDQLHYHATEALDIALEMMGSGPDQHWLETGSGIGGPARYLAHRGGIRITATQPLLPSTTFIRRSTVISSLVNWVDCDFVPYVKNRHHE